jgi:tRNA-binding protein
LRRAPSERSNIMAGIVVEDFQKLEMRVGKIVGVEEFTEARNPSYKLRIDFGPYGVKKSAAAIRRWYSKEDLLGRHVVAVTNFPARQIGPFSSDVLCLGAVQPDGRVIMLRPDSEGALGARIA